MRDCKSEICAICALLNCYMKRFKLRVIAIFHIFLFSYSVSAEPTSSISVKYYDISPMIPEEIGREMHNRSPIKKNGVTFKGNTKWNVKWNFKWKKRSGICKITKVKTHLTVIYTMPRISVNHSATLSVITPFNNYYNALMKHEEGHKDSGLYAARDIESTLLKLAPDTDCNRLSNSANRTGRKIIKKYNQRDIDYDKKTNHGKLDGVNIKNFI